MSSRTPPEKKLLDYKHQKRTNWDSDKGARKAIPAAKRRKRKSVRQAGDGLLRQAKKIARLAQRSWTKSSATAC